MRKGTGNIQCMWISAQKTSVNKIESVFIKLYKKFKKI